MSLGEIYPGWHAAESAIANHPEYVLKLWLQQGRDDKRATALAEQAKTLGIPIEMVSRSALEKQSRVHQGVIAWLKSQTLPAESELFELLEKLAHPPFLLVLDGIQDPHNLGACLRTADAAGVDAVIIPKHHAVGLTPAVRKVACGAAESLPIFQVTNLARTLEQLKTSGIWISGLALSDEAVSIYDAPWQGAVAIVMGAEESGLRPITIKHCDRLVIIPMLGAVQSLNVSVATGVVLYTALQQRQST
jgi:23S rRNA (guanosine2251-2'-O)-methyltransferase